MTDDNAPGNEGVPTVRAADSATPDSRWPTALGRKHFHELPTALYALASRHARRALANIGATDSLDLVDQAFSIGASIELLVKATLASIDPHLIRGKNSGHETSLALLGRPKLNGRIPNLSTIGGKEGIKLLNEIADSGPTVPPGRDRLFTVRDSAVHLGVVDPDENDTALKDLVHVTRAILKVRAALGQDGSWETYWGDQLDTATSILRRADNELTTRYEQELLVARRTFQQRWGPSGIDEMLRTVLEHQKPHVPDESVVRPHKCPACSSQAWVTYDIESGAAEIDDSDAPHSVHWFVTQTGHPAALECNVCQIYLIEPEDLERAGLSEIELGEADANPDEIAMWEDAEYQKAVDMGYEG